MKKFLYQMIVLTLLLCPLAGATGLDKPLSPAQVKDSITDTLKVLNEVYLFPEKAKAIEKEMLSRSERGAYDHIDSTFTFRKQISDELAEISTDRHLSLMLVKSKDEVPTHVLTEVEDEFKNNYAFQKLEVLPGNVGYLKFNKFYQDKEAINTVKHAFGFLKDTDAMIIDLRDCIGGSPELVTFIASYFLPENTLMWRYHTRNDEEIYENRSTVNAGPEHFKNDFPLFILVGPDTASAAEMFTYSLKNLNKAVVVGEKTRGVAYAVSGVKINEFFSGRFSMGQTIDPKTGTNWELVGVLPDIKAELSKSLDTAHAKALELLKNNLK